MRVKWTSMCTVLGMAPACGRCSISVCYCLHKTFHSFLHPFIHPFGLHSLTPSVRRQLFTEGLPCTRPVLESSLPLSSLRISREETAPSAAGLAPTLVYCNLSQEPPCFSPSWESPCVLLPDCVADWCGAGPHSVPSCDQLRML